MNPRSPLSTMIVRILKSQLPVACALLALSAHAEPDLSAPEAATRAQSGKLQGNRIKFPQAPIG